MAGYQAQVPESGYPFTDVKATLALPRITKVSPASYAFAGSVAAIGEPRGNGVTAGVQASMAYGTVTYQASAAFGTGVDTLPAVTAKPVNTIKMTISRAPDGL